MSDHYCLMTRNSYQTLGISLVLQTITAERESDLNLDFRLGLLVQALVESAFLPREFGQHEVLVPRWQLHNWLTPQLGLLCAPQQHRLLSNSTLSLICTK